MNLSVTAAELAVCSSECLLLSVFEPATLSAPAQAVDQASGGYLTRVLTRGDLDGEAGTALLLHDVPGLAATRVLLVGAGKAEEFDRMAYEKMLKTAFETLAKTRVTTAVCALATPLPAHTTVYHAQRAAVIAALQSAYRYQHTKTPKPNARPPLQSLTLWAAAAEQISAAERAVQHGAAIARGMTLARDLGNLPGNLCTPTYLAERAVALAQAHTRLEVAILEEAEMARLGMGALLSVARGSRQPPKLIVLRYHGGQPGERPIVLIGKGITFDAGGISLKSATDMDEMKFDMSGGAAVLGTLQVAAELALPLELVGLVPAAENLPDGNANKPGDIITTMSGQTVEILNTDAEGRLLLCDALTYSERFDPALVLDLATLTGACVVALGRHPSGLFTADETLAAELIAAGEAAADRVWRLPLWKDYENQLESNFADVANVGGREGGAVTAALFLARFAKKFPWAHLDIAGTAWLTGKEKGATGRPVALLSEFLLRRAGA